MDMSNYVLRLKSEQDKALSNTKIQLSKWQAFKDDYLKVKKKLEELPLEITHTHMVPFGPLAMMPGELIHTNEVLVLLGDNWFVDMSANNACQLIDRRLKDIDKSIGALEKQLHLLESRAHFTDQEFSQSFKTGDEVDITEVYDSDTEKEWKEKHRQSVRRERMKERQKDSQMAKSDDDRVFKLLSSLHEQELAAKEHSRLTDDTLTATDISTQKQVVSKTSDKPSLSFTDETPSNNRKSVRWRDELSESSLDDYDSDDSSTSTNSSNRERLTTGTSIRFKHSQEGPSTCDTNTDESDGSTVTSPRDIYQMFNTRKSSLKKTAQSEQGNAAITEPYFSECSAVLPQRAAIRTGSLTMTDVAVRSSVVEKIPDIGANDGGAANLSQTKSSTARVSKFKARRLKQTS